MPSPASPSAGIQSPGHDLMSRFVGLCCSTKVCTAEGARSCPSALQTNRYSISPGSPQAQRDPWMLLQSPPALLLKEAELKILKVCSFVWGFIALEDWQVPAECLYESVEFLHLITLD